jgi:hypothetical protein
MGGSAVNSTDISPEQAKVLLKSIGPTLGYLHRLRTRMEKRCFPPHDRTYEIVCKAYDAMHHLSVHLHYLSVGTGVYLPRSKDE